MNHNKITPPEGYEIVDVARLPPNFYPDKNWIYITIRPGRKWYSYVRRISDRPINDSHQLMWAAPIGEAQKLYDLNLAIAKAMLPWVRFSDRWPESGDIVFARTPRMYRYIFGDDTLEPVTSDDAWLDESKLEEMQIELDWRGGLD